MTRDARHRDSVNQDNPKGAAKGATVMNRRDVLRLGTAVSAGFSIDLLNGSSTSAGHAAARGLPSTHRPNILLILTDQQHAGMMSCAGNRWVKTPAMDTLAARGVRFEKAYCANPVCVPSRFSMMTGVLPSRISMDRNGPASFPVGEAILKHSLGHVFRNAGYQTVYGGKVHLPGTRDKGIAAYGFDLLSGDEREGLASACADFFNRERQQPFLLVASFINPHDICYMAIDAFTGAKGHPLMFPKSERERECLAEALKLPPGVSREEFFARICPPLPANFEITDKEPSAVRGSDWREFRQHVQENWSTEEWRLHRWAYARLTERVDTQIGTILNALEAAGLDGSTVVVFTSDHGDMDAAHRLEHKSMPYEEATRVPLIVSQPGVTLPGQVDRSHLVSTGLDLIPTLCDFAGIEAPPSLGGESIKPLSAAPTGDLAWRDCLVIENEASRVVVGDGYKYAVYAEGEPRELLVDLKSDPGEMRNLAPDAQHSEILSRYRRLLPKWYQENGESLEGRYLAAD